VAHEGLGVSFFELPTWQPPSGYRIPPWLRPPEHMVPGVVPVELLLARNDTHAVLVTHVHAFPTGVDFILTVRPRPGQPRQRRHDLDRPHRLAYHDLGLELRFADGRIASNDPRRWPRSFEDEQPDPPLLYYHGRGGCEGGWRSHHWLWGLPPPGPLAFVCGSSAGQLPPSGVQIDAGLVLEAAARAAAVWPTG
jgi:hypothetical protein